MADGSVGWCAMIGCDGGYLTAFLDQDVAREMYRDLLVATGAAATTTGQAGRVPGGYRVTGRFRSSAAVIIANGRGSAAPLSRTAHSRSMLMGCPKHGNVSCDYLSARSLTRGTQPGCAAPAATTSSFATFSSRKSTPSVSRTHSWSSGRGRFTRSPSCLSRKDRVQHSASPAMRSMR